MSYSTGLIESHSLLKFQSYSPGCITISDRPYHNPLLLSQESIFDTKAPHYTELTPNTIHHWLAQYNCDLILIGSGPTARFIDESLFLESNERGIGHAIMSTDDCIRTLVALQSESRSVVCHLTP